MKNQNGFTLVELAIVLMIIGLLIGGVLRGQELLGNARVAATVQQVKSYEGAVITFRDLYGSLPGDMPLATSKLPGCTAQNNCVNGNGNGWIDNTSGATGTYADAPWNSIDPSVPSEGTQFWKQLALAHLISGIEPSAATPQWGKSHPIAKIGNSGFFVRWTTGDSGLLKITGHILVLRRSIDGVNRCGDSANPLNDCSISPARASQIDRKMDNGVALTGSVWAISNVWLNGCGRPSAGINGPDGYNDGKEDDACEMMFLIN